MSKRATRGLVRARFGRAMLLRCPRCGGGGILRHWFRMKDACPTCGLALERGEVHDFWMGAYVMNLAATETLSVVIVIAYLMARWPEPNWALAQWGGVALGLATPLLFFPFSRTLWLAWDLSFRPTEPGDRGP